jgi:hypothetical protein
LFFFVLFLKKIISEIFQNRQRNCKTIFVTVHRSAQENGYDFPVKFLREQNNRDEKFGHVSPGSLLQVGRGARWIVGTLKQ